MHTQRMLFAASGGYCQNPECSRGLFIEVQDQRIHVAEMAHVFAAKDKGPRSKAELSEEQRGIFENLILLCSLCHTIIDKAPEIYSDSVVLGWKNSHAEKLLLAFGATHFETRHEARASIEGILRENHQIFQDYGPHISDATNPESGSAERWKRKVVQRIIPNNRKILTQIDANRHLIDEREQIVLERFRQHIDDLEARHILGYKEDAARFPEGMSEILRN